ncbi:MAG: alpha/beta hydrolase [Candidatus Sumerlaeota bacterium]|nr:alpha/beta hydrolase [Candidatus Sumerlaeota bacterium]
MNRSVGIVCALGSLAPFSSAQENANEKPSVPPTFADVKYGPYDANVLDLWQAKSDKPTPVLINIHGGGFIAGTKNESKPVLTDLCLKSGVSYASIEYRFAQVAPYPAPFTDCARAVQFFATTRRNGISIRPVLRAPADRPARGCRCG